MASTEPIQSPVPTVAPVPALERLARFVAEAPLEPSAAEEGTVRDALIDTFGCILYGARLPVARKARDALRQLRTSDGRAGAPVFGCGETASPAMAAFLNAVSGHASEFDDWELPGNTHPSVVMFPAVLAGADRTTSGAQVVAAYLAGFEVIARLGEAFNFDHYDAGWHSTLTLGSLGTAAAMARLRGLDVEQTRNALSIAASRASGFTCQFGSDAKALHAGFAAETGVVAAALAGAGLKGQGDVLEHRSGMQALMAGGGGDRLDAALDNIGPTTALAEHGLVFKPWPSCGYTHRILGCAISLRQRGVHHGTVARIDIELPDFHANILPFGHPGDRREALFSVPYCAAMGLVTGDLTLDDLADEAWGRPEVARLIGIAQVRPFAPSRPELNYDPDQPDRLTLTFADETTATEEVAYPLGSPQNPMSGDAVMRKFLRISGIGRDGRDDALRRLENWPTDESVLTVLESLGGPA